MKICPKCKQRQEDIWQMCGRCKVELVTDYTPVVASVAVKTAAVAATLCALVPVASAFILRAHKEAMVPPFLRSYLRFFSKRIFVAVSVFVLLVNAWFLLQAIIQEFVDPETMMRRRGFGSRL